MSRMRRQEVTALRRPRKANQIEEGSGDAGELLVAELQARRVRLQKLLALVVRDAERKLASPVKRTPARTHSRRQSLAMKQIA